MIEYVGEMLTQDQAQRYGQMYDEIKRRLVANAQCSVGRMLVSLSCYRSEFI